MLTKVAEIAVSAQSTPIRAPGLAEDETPKRLRFQVASPGYAAIPKRVQDAGAAPGATLI